MGKPDVVFVSAPYVFPPLPSLALSMFKTRLQEEGIFSWVYYPMFRMIELMGWDLCVRLASIQTISMYEEYTFSHLSGGAAHRTLEDYAVLAAERDGTLDPDVFAGMLQQAIAAAEVCTEEAARRIAALHPDVVAASSLFTQNNATLAILKRVRELDPDIRTMMGGANCGGESGAAILRYYPQVDAVFFGEGDRDIAQACRALARSEKEKPPYGLVFRGEPLPQPLPYPMTPDLNETPIPDYSDYYQQLGEIEPALLRENLWMNISYGGHDPVLPLEGSRGCWWGEKHPCAFCALNGEKNVYRSKTPRRLFEEIKLLSERHNSGFVELTDNVLSPEDVRELPDLLGTLNRECYLVCEVRTGLREQELKRLRGAGFRWMQAGIETLQDHLLACMGKGGSAVSNVAFLKYAARNGIQILWNLLYAVPGEKAEDYEELIALIPRLTHLEPPQGICRITYQRYSRYLLEPEKYGLELAPGALYPFLYGDDPELIDAMAFFYDLTGGETYAAFQAHTPLYTRLRREATEWQNIRRSGSPARLSFCDRGDYIRIVDTRPCRKTPLTFLRGAEAALCSVCDAPISRKAIMEKLGGRYSVERIQDAMEWMEEHAYLIRLRDQYLFIALPEETEGGE